MKRLYIPVICLVLLLTCALGDGALSKSMPSPVTDACGLSRDQWLMDDDSRALLTVSLWQDYCAIQDAEPCPVTGLTGGSLVALHDSAGYLMVVIPVSQGRLTIYYLPQSNTAAYMWQGGDYDSSYKQEALLKHGMSVWMNDAEAVKALLPAAEE